MQKIYGEFKDRLLADLELEKTRIILNAQKKRPEPLFDITEDNEKIYSQILRLFEITVKRHIEFLTSNLCKKYGIECESGNNRNYDIHIVCDGRRNAVNFKSSPMNFNSARLRYFIENAKKNDGDYCIVFLLRDSIESELSLKRFSRMIKTKDSDAQINVMLFEEFIAKYFGQEEKSAFLQALMELKEEIHEGIGYKITEICSDANKRKLKIELAEDLANFDYTVAKQNSGLTDERFSAICDRYTDDKRYKLLLGSGDFANSFITSEWLFKKYFALESLDNTFIVAGYFKSVEQLLWDIVMSGNNAETLFDKAATVKRSQTLGMLEKFIADPKNEELFDDRFGAEKNSVAKSLAAKIAQWRVAYRNYYFHKNRLDDKETVEQIRRDTICLHMLILGSVKIDEKTKNRLLE